MADIAGILNAHPTLQRRFYFLARRFVAGETIASALQAVMALNASGLSASLDFLGEDVTNERDAAHATDTYVDLIDRITALGADANVSVKLSAIGQSISEDMAVENLARIVARARPSEMFVRLDMEGSATVDSTYRVFDRARADYPHLGPVVQAYLHRAAKDVAACIEHGVRVRLCKGAYKEPPSVAIQEMPLIRRNYGELAEALLTSGRYPAIATHDESLLAAVREYAERHKVGPDRFEFQMLYGVRPESQRAIVRQGYRMRVYVPFGSHWAGYFYRRVAERRENLFFALRSMLSR
ncbi:MAG: proline dehydrogenase family protein [Candidatus Eremiobacteraeota bacterium]|nr:proline dehydrogenase family protein [Candidatus Eremiobacteraeota bacterium]MBC5826807.1 proline dehydrogenase family protein [Candidatus Eremiobacteraeota bacterium]